MAAFLEPENSDIDFPDEFPLGWGITDVWKVGVMGSKVLKCVIFCEKWQTMAVFHIIMTSYVQTTKYREL